MFINSNGCPQIVLKDDCGLEDVLKGIEGKLDKASSPSVLGIDDQMVDQRWQIRPEQRDYSQEFSLADLSGPFSNIENDDFQVESILSPHQISNQMEPIQKLISHQPSSKDDTLQNFQSKEQIYNGKKKTNKRKQVRKIYKNQYPTKNFLQSFRSRFLEYTRKKIGNDEEFNKFQIIKKIKAKMSSKKQKDESKRQYGINLKDYQNLFNQKEFRQILEKYFKNKVIVRDLIRSRINLLDKMEFLKRIHVFEKAFNTGVFEKINN